MLISGKFCRFAAAVTALLFLSPESHALEIRFSNPFARDSGLFSFRDKPEETNGAEATNAADRADSVPEKQRVVRADNYLQASRSPRVAFVALSDLSSSPERETPAEVTEEKREFPRFSDFLKALEADRQEAPEDQLAGKRPEKEVTAEVTEAAEGEPERAGFPRFDFDLPVQPQTFPDIGVIPGASPDDRLFRRPGPREDKFGHIFFFFPSESFDFESGRNYSPDTPAGRFRHFTPPAQPLPRSSARFRSVP
ncbi:MAG: hypothetical protein LAT55_00610 [Opitutales bacterium]|nr:hypothetical protein [Opitutales bacterium]